MFKETINEHNAIKKALLNNNLFMLSNWFDGYRLLFIKEFHLLYRRTIPFSLLSYKDRFTRSKKTILFYSLINSMVLEGILAGNKPAFNIIRCPRSDSTNETKAEPEPAKAPTLMPYI